MAVVNNDLSSIVGFQFTDSFRNENPQFVKFIQSYYQFLESIQLHFESVTGTFIEGEIVTGVSSGATAKIMSIDTSETIGSGTFVYVSQTNNVIFKKMETINGANGASGMLHHYRRNPLNAVKMVFDWDNINSPNNDMIYNFRHELFENFPGEGEDFGCGAQIGAHETHRLPSVLCICRAREHLLIPCTFTGQYDHFRFP